MARLLSSFSSVVIFFIHFQILLITQAIAQQEFLYDYCENKNGNYTRNSTYEANLNDLLSILPSQGGNGYGFYNLSYGNSSNQAYAIGLCRGDANPDVCVSCLNNATQRLPQNCPNQKEAVGGYDYCMLRYSNRSIFGVMETSRKIVYWNDENVSSNVDEFLSDLRTLLDGLKNRAASGGSLRKFATGNASAPHFQTLYALVQCTPDLSKQDCNNCLDNAFAHIPACCENKIGGRVIGTNCNFRYEIKLFYNQTDDAPLTTTTGGNESNTSRTTVIIAVVSSAAVALVLIISVCVFLKKRGAKKIDQKIVSVESLHYSFETIRVATDNFSEANKLGVGGFGFVYRGKLPNGQDIAVKRLSRTSKQGDLEFKNEVLVVAKLQHRNLVRLLGFCLKGSERLLVYEFVPNASLDHFIFDRSKRANLDWEGRYKIIGGIARGLLYLHEDSRLRVIHRDLKASNILLDIEMHPKISDFGLARLFAVDQTNGSTERIVGTRGYMAPEYALGGHFSVRIDIFSFGVLLLEIVSGRKNTPDHTLLSDVWKNWCDGTPSNIIDPLVRVNSVSEIKRFIHIGLLCVQKNEAHRPTMNTVVLMLNNNSPSLPVPLEPGFLMNSNIGSNSRTTESDHSESKSVNEASANEASISELYPR